MKIHLATFYSSDLKRSADRFKEQATGMNIYDYIHIFNQDDLNEDFKDYVQSLLNQGKKRGFVTGYGKLIFINWFFQKWMKEMFTIGVM